MLFLSHATSTYVVGVSYFSFLPMKLVGLALALCTGLRFPALSLLQMRSSSFTALACFAPTTRGHRRLTHPPLGGRSFMSSANPPKHFGTQPSELVQNVRRGACPMPSWRSTRLHPPHFSQLPASKTPGKEENEVGLT